LELAGVDFANKNGDGSGVRLHRRAFESAGIEFIEENGGGPEVRLRKGLQKKLYKRRFEFAERPRAYSLFDKCKQIAYINL
jgi:hypothetical protein